MEPSRFKRFLTGGGVRLENCAQWGDDSRAVKSILVSIVAAVLLVGCGPSVPDISIHEAARTGNIEAVKLHLAGGMGANAKDEGGWAPLHGAFGSGQKEIVELLLANGAKTALSGKSPLDYAVRAGHEDIADLLRQHGGETRAELKAAGK